ncbi:MAG: cobalamin-dependent protein, partial [Candidatus Omnitrophica bacterium]|nr:cobalamin-dependent protein [Candidatus Omnitrophota bacterium]
MNKEIYLVMVAERAGEKIPPFPLLYVGASLRKAGYSVQLRHIFPEDIPATSEEIVMREPLWAGFSVLTGLPTLRSAQMSRRIKLKSRVPVVWGGVHPSLLPAQCIAEEYIDYLVIGEGEETAVELSRALQGKRALDEVAGIMYKSPGGEPVRTARREGFIDLSEYPLDFDLCDLNRYITTEEVFIGGKRTRVRSLGYCASRGCPHACGFCYNLEFNLRRWRGPCEDFVINDIRRLKKEYGISKVHFWDDNFFANAPRALRILDGIDMAVGADVRIDYVNEQTARGLRRNKVVFLLIGIESGSNRILERIHKGFTVDAIVEGARLLNEYGIPALYSAILGFPTETRGEFNATVDLLLAIRKLHRQASFTVGMYLPYPGTDLYELAVSRGFQPPDTTEGWHVIDRWNNRVPLPWSDPDVCRNVRHLFFFLVNSPCWMRRWAAFRLGRKLLAFDPDIKLYLVTAVLLRKIASCLGKALRGPRAVFFARRALIEIFLRRHGLKGISAFKHRIFGLPDIGTFGRMSCLARMIRSYGIDTALRQTSRARILDAGCGDGMYSLYLARLFPAAHIDACDREGAEIKNNLRAKDEVSLSNVLFEEGDLARLSCTGRYDLFICISVLIYASDEDNRRILRNL